jgi:hypothetical protein
MSRFDEGDDIRFSEPILAQKGVKVKIGFAERTEWEAKTKGVKNGQKYDACKLTLTIDDKSVKTEHADASPRLTIEDQFNIVSFPYEDKQTGEVRKLGRDKLYQLEEAFGFEPIFKVGDQVVPPYVTKNGKKVAPKLEGVKRIPNPDFFNAYFSSAGDPIVDSWVDKTIYADIKLEQSEQFGSRNSIARYVKTPAV